MSGAQVGDLGLLDIGDGRHIPVKVTRIDRKGWVTEATRPLPGKGKAVFRGPCLTLQHIPAASLPGGVDEALAALPVSLKDLNAARAAIEPYHVPVCASCNTPIPGDNHAAVLCSACRANPARTVPAYR